MKRHADQLAREAGLGAMLERRRIRRVNAPFVSCDLHRPGQFVVALSMKDAHGKQMNYMSVMELDEMRAMGIEQQPRDRELMPDWARKEQEVSRKRHAFTDHLGKTIAAAMLEYLEKNEPQFGYSPEEWEEMSK